MIYVLLTLFVTISCILVPLVILQIGFSREFALINVRLEPIYYIAQQENQVVGKSVLMECGLMIVPILVKIVHLIVYYVQALLILATHLALLDTNTFNSNACVIVHMVIMLLDTLVFFIIFTYYC